MNRSFLLERAEKVGVLGTQSWHYNAELELNVISDNQNSLIPVCTLATMITGSKTEAAPGDDDPDPDTEFMY